METPPRSITADAAVEALRRGAILYKYGRSGNPHFREFVLRKDDAVLEWESKGGRIHGVPIRDVREIRLGQTTPIFQRRRLPEVEHLSFSLMYGKERSLDLVCKDETEFTTWVKGLSHLVSKHTGNQFGDVSQSDSDTASDTDTETSRTSAMEEEPSTVQLAETSSFAEDTRTDRENTGSLHKNLRNTLRTEFQSIQDVYLWGSNTKGQLAMDSGTKQAFISSPKLLEPLLELDVVNVALGTTHVLAVTKTGDIFSWGDNTFGALGTGDVRSVAQPLLLATMCGRRAKSVSAGMSHSAAITQDGELLTWGLGLGGKLGHGNEDPVQIPKVVRSLQGISIRQISCGTWHSSAISSNGELFTWGLGVWGQLGHGSCDSAMVPTMVRPMHEHICLKVSCGFMHTGVITRSGEVFVCGDNSRGQLGLGDKVARSTFTVSSLFGEQAPQGCAVDISCSMSHSVVLTAESRVLVCGAGEGVIGDPRLDSSKVWAEVRGLADKRVQQIAAGEGFTLALGDGGAVYAWGAIDDGRLGIPEANRPVRDPTQITALSDKHVTMIACGAGIAAALCGHQWLSEADSKECMLCKSSFSLMRRKNRCRNCGGFFCSDCSRNRIPLLKFGYETPVRVCNVCHERLTKRKPGEVQRGRSRAATLAVPPLRAGDPSSRRRLSLDENSATAAAGDLPRSVAPSLHSGAHTAAGPGMTPVESHEMALLRAQSLKESQVMRQEAQKLRKELAAAEAARDAIQARYDALFAENVRNASRAKDREAELIKMLREVQEKADRRDREAAAQSGKAHDNAQDDAKRLQERVEELEQQLDTARRCNEGNESTIKVLQDAMERLAEQSETRLALLEHQKDEAKKLKEENDRHFSLLRSNEKS